MRITYSKVVKVDRLKQPYEGLGLSRSNGYAVMLEDEWFWFPALEPAYTFGRAGRMSAQVGSWGLFKAATEVRWDDVLRRDIFTLYYVGDSVVSRDPVTDRQILAMFASGVNSRSSHWRGER